MNREKKKEIFLWWILLAVVIFLSFYFDNRIVMLIASFRTNGLNAFFLDITSTIAVIIIILLLIALFIPEKRRNLFIPLWLSVGISYVIGFLLKIIIQRQRPFQLGLVSAVNVVSSSYSSWDFSFPSLHAVLVFSVIPFISKKFPKFKYVWIIFACLIAFSRVYLGVHFLSDVIVGAIIGYLVGYFMLKRVEGKL